MPKRRKDYTAKFKFQRVVERLQPQGADGEIAHAYGVHGVSAKRGLGKMRDEATIRS